MSRSITMSRLALACKPRMASQMQVRTFVPGQRYLADKKSDVSENSTPGWAGRHGEDHALNRDGHDVQSKTSRQSRSDKEQGTGEGGQGVTQKDERNANQKAKEDHPEAPGPVIGMNSERGSKGA